MIQVELPAAIAKAIIAEHKPTFKSWVGWAVPRGFLGSYFFQFSSLFIYLGLMKVVFGGVNGTTLGVGVLMLLFNDWYAFTRRQSMLASEALIRAAAAQAEAERLLTTAE